jgi:hypothetical protein
MLHATQFPTPVLQVSQFFQSCGIQRFDIFPKPETYDCKSSYLAKYEARFSKQGKPRNESAELKTLVFSIEGHDKAKSTVAFHLAGNRKMPALPDDRFDYKALQEILLKLGISCKRISYNSNPKYVHGELNPVSLLFKHEQVIQIFDSNLLLTEWQDYTTNAGARKWGLEFPLKDFLAVATSHGSTFLFTTFSQ